MCPGKRVLGQLRVNSRPPAQNCKLDWDCLVPGTALAENEPAMAGVSQHRWDAVAGAQAHVRRMRYSAARKLLLTSRLLPSDLPCTCHDVSRAKLNRLVTRLRHRRPGRHCIMVPALSPCLDALSGHDLRRVASSHARACQDCASY